MDFSGPRCHSVVEMMKNPSLSDLDSSGKCHRDPRIFLARSATHYKFDVNPRFSWPKIHSVKEHDTWIFLARYRTIEHMTLEFSWPGISDFTRDMILRFSWSDHSSRDFCPRVFLARFVDPWGLVLRFSWPDTSPNNKMAFGFSWPSCPLDTQVFLA